MTEPLLGKRTRALLWALLGCLAGAFLLGTTAVVLGQGLTDATLRRVQDVANLIGFCLGGVVGYLYGMRRALRPQRQPD